MATSVMNTAKATVRMSVTPTPAGAAVPVPGRPVARAVGSAPAAPRPAATSTAAGSAAAATLQTAGSSGSSGVMMTSAPSRTTFAAGTSRSASSLPPPSSASTPASSSTLHVPRHAPASNGRLTQQQHPHQHQHQQAQQGPSSAAAGVALAATPALAPAPTPAPTGQKKVSWTAMLAPFLQKLLKISQTFPADVSGWAPKGDAYVVRDTERFEAALKQHFKGSLQTFVRQLHFYGFRKLETQRGAWSFAHPNFQRDRPELMREIRRRARADAQVTATQAEVKQLRSQVTHLEGVVEDLRTQLDSVLTVLGDAGLVRLEGTGSKALVKTMVAKNRKRSRLAQGGADPSTSVHVEAAPAQTADDSNATSTNGSINCCSGSGTGASSVPQASATSGRTSRASSFGDMCGDIEPMALEAAADLEMLTELDLGDEADLIYREMAAAQQEEDAAVASSPDEAHSAADLVAQATELDPKSVSKVLGFLQKTVHGKDGTSGTYPEMQRALRDYQRFGKPHPLPAQEVGAN